MPRRHLAPCALLAIAACADGGATPIDAPAVDTPAVDAPDGDATQVDAPPLARHTFVVSRTTWPRSAAEALSLGLDIDQLAGDTSGGIDNQLGTFLGSLRGIAPALDIHLSDARAIDRGEAIALVELFAVGLTASPTATTAIHVGADPQPAACTGPADTTCRRHLTGTASIGRAAGSAAGTPMPGAIVGQHLTGGPGTFTLQVGIGPTLVAVPMAATRVDWGTTATGLATGKLGGGIARSDFDATIVPALGTWFGVVIDADCPAPRSGPSCNCANGSTGASLLSFLDADNDCTATAAEVRATLDGLITNDLDLDHDGTNDAVSLGIGVEAVAATFP
ncbi:MAG: hypothetical protein JNK64_40300 [Myxococcales bacterium]|nr:hypothetical protein [Myxococcales bacterium]